MTSQFVRLNCYGRQAGARRKSHENAYDILKEAERAPGSAPHVRNPKPPIQLHGIPIGSVRDQLDAFVRTARDRRGAPVRRDGTVLYAIVASYPRAWRELDHEGELELYQQWRGAVVDWLCSIFGDSLQSAVEHIDETRPHLHGFVIPPLCLRNRIDHRLHPGHAARDAVLESGGDRLAGERAYRNGMRAWQDKFHEAVSCRFGHGRTGPRRKRFRRDVALMRQASDRFLERAQTITERMVLRLEALPSVVTPEDKAEIKTLAMLCRNARGRLLGGHADALETLDSALSDLVDAGRASKGLGDQSRSFDDGLVSVNPGWDGDEDLGPDQINEVEIDCDDDRDPEGFDRDGPEDDWDAEPDDGDLVEPFDYSDEVDPRG